MQLLARAPQPQLQLFNLCPSVVIRNNAQARNVYGALAQDVACTALELQAIPIDGHCAVCFDAERDGQFFEIKSVHASGKLVIYDWRAEKEAAFLALQYVLVVHKARGCKSVSELLASFACYLEIWQLPATTIHTAAQQCTLRQLVKQSTNSRNGYNRAGYCRGYRNVPLAGLRPSNCQRIQFPVFDRQLCAYFYG